MICGTIFDRLGHITFRTRKSLYCAMNLYKTVVRTLSFEEVKTRIFAYNILYVVFRVLKMQFQTISRIKLYPCVCATLRTCVFLRTHHNPHQIVSSQAAEGYSQREILRLHGSIHTLHVLHLVERIS